MKTSLLDEIPGIGAARKRALLAHFGSAVAVKAASMEDLQQVDGISENIAKSIYSFLHSR
jgi:excinuclease ABC subunit C